jgi:hypothetical protein
MSFAVATGLDGSEDVFCTTNRFGYDNSRIRRIHRYAGIFHGIPGDRIFARIKPTN